MTENFKTKIWISYLNGNEVLYDPGFQLENCPHVFLWSVEEKGPVKALLKKIKNSSELAGELDSDDSRFKEYMDWRSTQGKDWFLSEKDYYQKRFEEEKKEKEEAERIKSENEEKRRWLALSPKERHRERLARLGIPYYGVKKTASSHRVTHCYLCKNYLDNSIDIECGACGWILCDCGACGCAFIKFY